MMRRKACRQNRRHTPPPGQVCRTPDYCADDGRRIAGVKRMQAFAWNCMNQALDAKGEARGGENREGRFRGPVRDARLILL